MCGFCSFFPHTFELHGSMSTTRSSRGFMGSGKPCSKRHSLPSAVVTGSYVDAVYSSSNRRRLFDKATLLVQDVEDIGYDGSLDRGGNVVRFHVWRSADYPVFLNRSN